MKFTLVILSLVLASCVEVEKRDETEKRTEKKASFMSTKTDSLATE